MRDWWCRYPCWYDKKDPTLVKMTPKNDPIIVEVGALAALVMVFVAVAVVSWAKRGAIMGTSTSATASSDIAYTGTNTAAVDGSGSGEHAQLMGASV
eukprot:COSAG01_NODE_380_length_17862_cov_20.427212_10_plen_97_part_00